ncbi:MAG: DUF262 domain-containing protein [Alphaproteobacteria bacterium]|nr:DUF262 domain-containing protein [Alphaproteobacteria bacterium]
MAELQVSRKTIRELFENEKSVFLVPEYQRPYSWTKAECSTLWEDLFAFAIPDFDYSKFDKNNDEYFLGPIVTFLNNEEKLEIIDGQQRLTSLMLLLRAFYNKYEKMKDPKTLATKGIIERCIWESDEFGNICTDQNSLKLESTIITDEDKSDFFEIMKTGKIKEESSSLYAKNYRFFLDKIEKLVINYPDCFSYLSARLLNNCVILPIETESQDKAMYIFSTLNDRGLQLSDSDIFKSKFYKYYMKKFDSEKKDRKKREEFIENNFSKKWKNLEEICNSIFRVSKGNPMDELFIRYMYYERAKRGIKDTTTISLRKFYENPNRKANKLENLNTSYENYAILNDQTFSNLIILANFWKDAYALNNTRFSIDVLRKLFILKHAPNNLWTGITSVYFMTNKDANHELDNEKFCSFLEKITAFIFAYAVLRPGVNALRTPIYTEMVKIINGTQVDFFDFRFEIENTKNMFFNFSFDNLKPTTKALLTWWAFCDENQDLPNEDQEYQIEHIFANNRPSDNLSEKDRESLGNKSLLEKRINIRASDYRFCDKKKYYRGEYKNKNGKQQEKTNIAELLQLSEEKDDFTEKDIAERNEKIINSFIDHLRNNGLTK